MFSCEVCKIFISTYFVEHLRELLLLKVGKVMKVKMMMKVIMKVEKHRSQMFFKIGILKNFTNFIGKDLCWSFLVIKLQALRPATLLKTVYSETVFILK